jgi:hypothetical protein
MIPAHERAAIHLAFAEQGALMRTATMIGAEPALRSYDHKVQPVRGQGEGSVADEVIDPTKKSPGRPVERVPAGRGGKR